MNRRCTHNAGLTLQWLPSVMQLQSTLCLQFTCLYNIHVTCVYVYLYIYIYIYVHTYIQNADAQEPLATQNPRDPKQPKKPLRNQGTLFRGWARRADLQNQQQVLEQKTRLFIVARRLFWGWCTTVTASLRTAILCVYIYIYINKHQNIRNAQAM